MLDEPEHSQRSDTTVIVSISFFEYVSFYHLLLSIIYCDLLFLNLI